MAKKPGILSRFVTFIGDVRSELKKSTWPSRPELIESTIVVVLSVVILGAFVGFSDWVLEIIVDTLVN